MSSTKKMKLLLASNNVHKLQELSRILNPLGIDVVTTKEYGTELGEVEENGKTFAENARIKAEHAYKMCKIPAVADDTGLMVDALNGEPGVYTARYAGENATDSARINKLLSNMQKVADPHRTAAFVTSICCILDENTVIEVSGKCSGSIAVEPSGENGFGYDPIFVTEYGKTFAQLSSDEKDSISHRGVALRKLAAKLKEII